MKKLWFVFSLFIFLIGCNAEFESELSYSKVAIDSVDSNLHAFIDSVADTNGNYLYYAGEDNPVVILNGKNVIQGEQAIHFTDFSVEGDGETLKINYIEAKTDNYSDKTLNHLALYEIKLDKDYEVIQIFKNGEEVTFTAVSGKTE